MEHAVSDSLVDRIDAYLGHPTTDPHGDPIPKADGTVAAAPDDGRWLSARLEIGFASRGSLINRREFLAVPVSSRAWRLVRRVRLFRVMRSKSV